MKKDNILPYIGGLVGALIGTIPWVLVYVYLNYILSLLAIIIAFLSFKGYILLHGKKKKNTWLVISIFSLIAITIATFILIPFLLNLKNGLGFSLTSFKDLYQIAEFKSALINDYFISLLFAVLGISVVTSKLKKEVDDDSSPKEYDETDTEKILNIFKKYKAYNKQSAISKTILEQEIDFSKYKTLILNFKKRRIIIGNKKMYLDEKAYTNLEYANKVIQKHNLKVILLTILLVFISLFIIILIIPEESIESNSKLDNNLNIEEVNYTDYKFLNYATYKLPEYLVIYEENTSDSYYLENNYYSITYTPLKTYRDDPIFDTIFVDYIKDYYYDDFNEYRNYILESSSEEYEILEVNLLSDKYNYETIEIKALSNTGRLYYDYYLFYNNDSIFFEFASGIDYDANTFQTEINKVLNSLNFLENISVS